MSQTLKATLDPAKIDAIFAAVDQGHAPGAAVGVAIGGRPVYRRGFGLANVELPVLLAPTMRMRIGSTTKHFACLAYMLLCEEGLAGLDDPVRKHIPELHPVADKITMRQLMGHLSGLRDAYDLSMQFSGPGRPIPTAEMLATYFDLDNVNTAPGETWNYNNGGYVMLSVAIERLTGASLEEVLRERIFAPVGMTDTLLRRKDSDFVPNSATLHNLGPDGAFCRDYMGMDIAGEGGMVSTVDDMLRWLAHMDAPVVGSAETWATMTTPQTLNSGFSTGYGLGLMMGAYRGARTVQHGGGVMGGNSQMIKVVDAGLDIAIMVNRADVFGALLANQIIDACVEGLAPRPEAADTNPARGQFYSRASGTLVSLHEKGGMEMLSIDGMDLPARRTDDGRIVPALDGFHFFVRVPDEAEPAQIAFHNFGHEEPLSRLEAAPDASPEPLVGRYASEASGVGAEIEVEDGVGRMRAKGRFGEAAYTLDPVAPGLWRMTPVGRLPVLGGTVELDGQGGFRFTSARTRRLAFRKIG